MSYDLDEGPKIWAPYQLGGRKVKHLQAPERTSKACLGFMCPSGRAKRDLRLVGSSHCCHVITPRSTIAEGRSRASVRLCSAKSKRDACQVGLSDCTHRFALFGCRQRAEEFSGVSI